MTISRVGAVVRVQDREPHHPEYGHHAQGREAPTPAPASPAAVASAAEQASGDVLREEALVRIAHDFRSEQPPQTNPLKAIALYKATARVRK